MVKLQLTIMCLVVGLCVSNAEARGRRMVRQPAYTPYYNTVTPTYNVAPTTVVSQPAATVTTSTTAPATDIVQTSATESANAVTPANSVSTSSPASAKVAAPAAVGSAQWKAEQSARMGSVAHIGGGFGGGSFEGNGFGATPEQAIQNSCFWGQRTPIEIGVARGANGYYATIFYR